MIFANLFTYMYVYSFYSILGFLQNFSVLNQSRIDHSVNINNTSLTINLLMYRSGRIVCNYMYYDLLSLLVEIFFL